MPVDNDDPDGTYFGDGAVAALTAFQGRHKQVEQLVCEGSGGILVLLLHKASNLAPEGGGQRDQRRKGLGFFSRLSWGSYRQFHQPPASQRPISARGSMG